MGFTDLMKVSVKSLLAIVTPELKVQFWVIQG